MEKNNNIRDFRVPSLKEFYGQDKITNELKIYIYSAIKRKDVLDHILLYGPPGLGKTTLAELISKELKGKFHVIAGSNIKEIGDILAILANINRGDVLFIDEIHRLNHEIEEMLYSIMDNFTFSITLENNSETKLINIDIEKFTLIGATTLIGNISTPFRDRFVHKFKFEYYDALSLSKIIEKNLKKINVEFVDKICLMIARASRGTPRLANTLIRKIHDFMIFKNLKILNIENLLEIYKNVGINDDGLTEQDIIILKVFKERFNNEPVSLEAISNVLNENVDNIKEVNEPYLVYLGFIDRTKRGRRLTLKALEYLKKY